MPRNPEEDRLSPEEREDRERQATQAPTAPVEASGSEREHGPKCWGKTSISDEMMYCYCGSTDSPPRDTREAVLKGVGKVNGDGWKDTTTKGATVFVWNAEKPAPYAPGQYPRVGNEGWSASTSQYDFTPATADDVPAILALLSARPLALGGQHSTATDFPPDDVLACVDDTTPARAEAQDEGAGEPVAWAIFWRHGVTTHPTREAALAAPGRTVQEPVALYARPSPTPAADADRVRIAVELINAEINAPLTGPTHGAWDRGRIAGLKEALAALKSEGK